jgi:hypothetical protein
VRKVHPDTKTRQKHCMKGKLQATSLMNTEAKKQTKKKTKKTSFPKH